MGPKRFKKFDLVILGGGAGGFAAAIRAQELGARSALVNAGLPLGGTCVNVGCVPSKALLQVAETLHLTKTASWPGLRIPAASFNFQKTIQDELSLVKALRREKYEKVLANLKKVSLFKGRGRFLDAHHLQVDGHILKANRFIISTGSTARVPDVPGLKEAGYLTHIEALQLKKLPKRLLVLGAGPLGLEFAQMFSRFGSQVTLLQRSEMPLKETEPAVAIRLAELLRSEGIALHTRAKMQKVSLRPGEKQVSYERDGKISKVKVDAILLAAGKVPNTSCLGLEEIGVAISTEGAVVVRPHLQTSQPHIYAVGDAAQLPRRLEATAGKEGSLAAENALTGSQKFVDYDSVPYTVFTDPQVAGVGLTEKETVQRFGACQCRTLSLKDLPKAIILKRTEGLLKMVTHPKKKYVVGVHMVGPQAAEIIAAAMLLVKTKRTLEDIQGLLPMFPTLSEGLKLVATSFTKNIRNLSCCI